MKEGCDMGQVRVWKRCEVDKAKRYELDKDDCSLCLEWFQGIWVIELSSCVLSFC